LVPFENHFIILHLANETEWPAANGMKGEVAAAAGGNDAKSAIGDIPQQGRVGLL
jgi:hypothetical protein